MRKYLVTMALLLLPSVARSTDLTLDNVTVNPGSTAQIFVRWTTASSILNIISSGIQITANSGAPGAVTFSVDGGGDPPVPPITQSSYIFFGDSSDVVAGGNPASVTMTSWTGDTYLFADMTDSGGDVTPTGLTNNLWTILNVTIAANATGTYQLANQGSEWGNSLSGNMTPITFAGGLITVVPEPSAYLMAMVAAGVLGMAWRRRHIRNL